MLDAAAMPPFGRETASNVFLTLGGVKCGPVRAVDGGFARADVVEQASTGTFTQKQLSGVRYDPFVVDVGLAMEPPVYDWVAASWKGDFARKTGSLVVADYKLDAKRERAFTGALLTETTIPVLDAASKDAGFLKLKFQPELAKENNAAGKQNGAGAKAKQWLRSGFRLQIDSLDCTKVSKIDSLSVKVGVQADKDGSAKLSELVPTKLEFPTLRITLSEVSSKTWFDWFEDFAIKGNNDKSSERSGTIQLLAPDAKTELARIKLFGLGIFSIAEEKEETHGDKVKRVTAEIYCERMELVVKP
jgi:hypothetical protein